MTREGDARETICMNGYRARNATKWFETVLGEQFSLERIKTPLRGREHA